MLTQSEVFEDEVPPGTESADHPPEEMPERRDHGKNLIETSRIELFAKSFILRVYDVLANDSYYLLKRKCHFQDLGVNYFDQLNHERLTRYFVKRLTRLGHRVTLEPCSAAA